METGRGKVCYQSGLVTKSSRVERQAQLNESLYQPDRERGLEYGRVSSPKGPPSERYPRFSEGTENARIAGKTKTSEEAS